MSKTKLWGGRFSKDTNALVDAFNASCFIRYSDGKHATISISHCNNRYCQCFRVYLYALAVTGLVFLSAFDFFYSHIIL